MELVAVIYGDGYRAKGAAPLVLEDMGRMFLQKFTSSRGSNSGK